MSTAQIVLVVSLLLLVLYVLVLRTRTSDRLMMMVLVGLGIVFVLWPNLTTRIANLLGIGRGADLVLYLFVILSLFFFVHVLSELGRQTRMITAIAREIALRDAERGGTTNREQDLPPTRTDEQPDAG